MSARQSDVDPALQRFLAWIDRRHAPDEAPSDFVPLTEIEGYFNLSNQRHIKEIIQAVFDAEELPPKPSSIAAGYARIFCILVAIGHGRFIKHFQRHDLTDSKLPFHVPPTNFPIDSSDKSFFDRFQSQQWRFCSPLLLHFTRTGDTREFPPGTIMPYMRRDVKGEGATSEVCEVEIHDAHDRLESSHRPSTGSDSPQNRVFALKTYRGEEARKWHDTELYAFQKLGKIPNMIEFFSSYYLDGTYNILLEFADVGTLEEYMHNVDEPKAGQDIFDIWNGLLEIFVPLMRIHDLRKLEDESYETRFLPGCHQDIKPGNILVKSKRGTSKYKYLFKLADFGISDFPKLTDRRRMRDHRGTQTYGAPEVYRADSQELRRSLPFSWSADIWSFGCVLSEVAVWVINGVGSSGLEGYRSRRAEGRKSSFSIPDCFHDGQELLEVVRLEHTKALSQKRQSDVVTQSVVNMIDNMLAREPSSRPSASYCRRTKDDLLQKARSELDADSSPASATTPSPSVRRSIPLRPHIVRTDISPAPIHDHDRLWESFADRSPGDIVQSPRTMTVDEGYEWSSPGRSEHDRRSINNKAPDGDSPTSFRSRRSTGSCQDSRPQEQRATGRSVHPPLPTSSSHGQRDPGRASTSEINTMTGSPRAPTKQRENIKPPARLSYAQAMRWQEEVKNRNRHARLPDHNFTGELADRDHVFIVDDSVTMQLHMKTGTGENEPDVTRLLKVLGYITKQFDPDGIDLRFTISKENDLDKCTSTDEMIAALRRCRSRGRTDFGACLKTHLQSYAQQITAHRKHGGASSKKWSLRGRGTKPLRPVTFYIFTDGVWLQSEHYGQAHIENLARKLKEAGFEKGQVGIQFISFGDDDDGLARLKSLDELNTIQDLPLDIIDTEPSNGSIWKMLLGAINPCFDADPSSPT